MYNAVRLSVLSAEHGYLRGKRKIASTSSSVEDPEDKTANRRTLMDLIIETINKCSEDFDEGVQVQVRMHVCY